MSLLPGLVHVDQTPHEATCARKRFYRRWADAERSASAATQRLGKLLMAYRCATCGGWHNTSISLRGLRARWARLFWPEWERAA